MKFLLFLATDLIIWPRDTKVEGVPTEILDPVNTVSYPVAPCSIL